MICMTVVLYYEIRPWDVAKHMESAAALAKELVLLKILCPKKLFNFTLRRALFLKTMAKSKYKEAYLSAILIYLYIHDVKQAEKCYNDCSQADAFLGNDHGRCASKLLSAYTEGDIEEIKRLAESSAVSHLDHMVMSVD